MKRTCPEPLCSGLVPCPACLEVFKEELVQIFQEIPNSPETVSESGKGLVAAQGQEFFRRLGELRAVRLATLLVPTPPDRESSGDASKKDTKSKELKPKKRRGRTLDLAEKLEEKQGKETELVVSPVPAALTNGTMKETGHP